LANPSAALLLALPQKDGTSRPLLEGLLSSLKESEPPFSCMAKSVSVTTEFDQVIALFYFGQSPGQVPPVPPVPPVSVSPVRSLPIPLAAPPFWTISLTHVLKQLAILIVCSAFCTFR